MGWNLNQLTRYAFWDFLRYISLIFLMIICGAPIVFVVGKENLPDQVLLLYVILCTCIYLMDNALLYRKKPSPSVYIAVSIIFVLILIRQIFSDKGQISINIPLLTSIYEEKFIKYSSCH